jgi:predicted secreted protein
MQTARGYWILMAGALLLLPACDDGTGPEDSDRLNLTAEDDGTHVRMSAGEFLRISLEENPSTGRSWQTDSADPDVLLFVDKTFQTDPACPPGTTGCGGTATLRFVAVGSGNTTLRLAHRMAGGGSVTDTFEVTVRVSS